jgi:hypothetical protein
MVVDFISNARRVARSMQKDSDSIARTHHYLDWAWRSGDQSQDRAFRQE